VGYGRFEGDTVRVDNVQGDVVFRLVVCRRGRMVSLGDPILLENVKKCWASLFTHRAIFYRFEKGLHDTHISVAVVVQKMVNSEKSGITF
jgi:hypothetical protein